MKERFPKRLSCALLSAAMAASMMPTVMAAGSDITGHWAEKTMQSFIDAGYLSGVGNNQYDPNGSMTRAQFAAILNEMNGLTTKSSAISGYKDVPGSAWYHDDMAIALAAGYMSGTSAATMSPNTAITRQEAMTMLASYLKLDTSDLSALEAFSDKDDIASWAKGSAAAMVAKGYVAGYDGKVNPTANLTRAEGVTMLNAVKEAMKAMAPVQTATYKDGTYTGTGKGYGGTLKVQVTISGGKMSAIEIVSHKETNAYLNRAQKIIDTLLAKQSTEGVDTVSGATISCKAILTAVDACLSQASGGADTSQTGGSLSGGGGRGESTPTEGEDFSDGLKDGVYEGSALGYSGTTKVQVTVADGKIAAVEVLSHEDTPDYFERAKQVIDRVVEKQTTDVDGVSGATYSVYGILNAVNDALKGAAQSGPVELQAANWAELNTALAKAQDGDTITITDDITDAGNLDGIASATVTINKQVTINGNGKTITAYGDTVTKQTVDKETGAVTATEEVDATFCFAVTKATGIQMKDLTIDGASFSSKLGGGMYVETGAEITMENVTFKNCVAASGSTHNSGGAIYVEPHRGSSPSLTAINCTFENNSIVDKEDGYIGRGGAVAGYNANIVLDGCTFKGNKAGWGGAVSAAGSSSLTVKNCTFEADNEALYGGDDIYIFDGYSFYKKTMAADSSVSYSISGNTYKGEDGENYQDYRVVLGRVLGEVTDTTNASSEIAKTCAGSGNKIFASGHDLTFAVTDYNRTGEPTESTAEGAFVLMNIPYDEFYAAEGVEGVDAVSTATVKTYNQNMAGGSYHEGSASIENPKESTKDAKILGVTYPVYVEDLSALDGLTKVTDEDTETITVASGKSSLTTKDVSGKDLLFASGDYAFYLLDEAPNAYKTLNVKEDGSFTFSAVSAEAVAGESMEVEMVYGAHYTDLEFNVTAAEITDTCVVNAITLTDSEGKEYALRHVEDIWRKVSLGWNWNSLDGKGLEGKNIVKVTYYIVDDGAYKIYEYDVDETVKLNPGEMTAAFEDANTVAVTGLPEDIQNAKATVKTKVGRKETPTVIAENVDVVDGKIITTVAAEEKTYTITVTSDNYGDVSTTADYAAAAEA